jgi:hypothetical protein
MTLSVLHETRRINRVSQQIPVHFLDGSVWWAKRLYPVQPNQATRDNNLFGFGTPGAKTTLGTEIEVNFPIGSSGGITQGAFVENLQTNSVTLAHRGRVNRHGVWFTLHVPQFRAELKKLGCQLIMANGIELISIGEVNSLQRIDIIDFVRNIDTAKSACVP